LIAEGRKLVEPEHPKISLSRQCQLLEINRSSLYYQPKGESSLNLTLMNQIDLQYTQTPFYGVRRMTEVLKRKGFTINRKRIHRLMNLMGLQAIFPKRSLSRRNPDHRIYPYLLRGMEITHRNHVWSTDITYIQLSGGFLYLTAVIDWYSRFVLSWRLSNTLDNYSCIEALREALTYGTPEIFNTDQGSQFTSINFTDVLAEQGIKISMDGRGRALDNIFVERLWRSVKYENVYLNDYRNGEEAYRGLADYFQFYNHERMHQSLDYRTPAEVYQLPEDGFSKALWSLSSDVSLTKQCGRQLSPASASSSR